MLSIFFWSIAFGSVVLILLWGSPRQETAARFSLIFSRFRSRLDRLSILISLRSTFCHYRKCFPLTVWVFNTRYKTETFHVDWQWNWKHVLNRWSNRMPVVFSRLQLYHDPYNYQTAIDRSKGKMKKHFMCREKFLQMRFQTFTDFICISEVRNWRRRREKNSVV